MAFRKNNLNEIPTGPVLGASADLNGLQVAAIGAAGVAAGVPVAVVLGVNTSMVAGAATAGAFAYAGHRAQQGEKPWQWFGKDDDDKKEDTATKNGARSKKEAAAATA